MQPADVLDYWFGDSADLKVDDLKEYFQRLVQGGKKIDKFGRFPHRNKVWQRQSMDEELMYLAAGAKSFGQKLAL